jgi:hypothetical protein
VEVQLTSSVKVAARILATDPLRDVAVLWIDPAAVASMRPVPLGCGQQTKPTVVKGQEIVALEAPLRQPKGAASGSVESVAARAIASDLAVGSGGAGGPVFTTDGNVIGITSFIDERVAQRRGDARVVRVGDVCEVVASATKTIKDVPPPSATHLPVEPARPYPADTLKDAAARRAGSLNPYQIASPDFDISFLTPVLSYAAQERQERRPLMGFANWSEYVADFPPVLLVRVTPRLVEGFWTKVARGAAQTQGVALPPIKRFRSGFSNMRAFCGDAEITPIHPFKLEHRIAENEAIYEGLYVFDPGAFGPECGRVKLVLSSEKEPDKGVTQLVDAKVVKQIWQDFESYRTVK